MSTRHVLTFGQLLNELFLVGLLLIEDINLALPSFGKIYFVLLFYLLVVANLLKGVDVQLIVNKINTLV